MAEGFEPYHVPQQSRRDKLRVNNQQPGCSLENLHSQTAPLYPSFYDPSLISPDLINLHRQSFNLGANPVKAEGFHLMGFMGDLNMITAAAAAASPSSEHRNNPMYADPHLAAVHLNPSTIQGVDGGAGGPYYNNSSNNSYRAVLDDQSFHGREVINHPTTTGQSLSLSLSSHHSNSNNNNNNNLPLELNLQRYDSHGYGNNKVSGLGGGYLVPGNGGGSSSVELTRSTVPLGPFTGYASVLNGSRFLKPAQQLLEEICEVGRGFYGEKVSPESSNLLDPPTVESLCGNHGVGDESPSCIDVSEQTRKKSGLLSMLEEVYKRYKMYYQQVQAVVASFESVAGLSNAAPFANLALKALTKHFKCLKDAITDHLQFAIKSHGKMNYERDETLTQRVENSGKGLFGQRSFQNVGFADQPVWRPQRGLPERAVTVLRAWLFEHFLHPYPTDTDKLMLAKQTGLSRNQVSNWFINARVRLWKPMVEEIHTLETRQGQKQPQRDEPPPNRPSEQLPSNSSFECENASSSIQRMGEFTLKRNREGLTESLRGSEGPTNLPYENLTHHPHFTSSAGGSSNVSLTLGLHQNGVGLPESYPMNAARRFGLDSNGDGYVLGGFGGQNRQFGRDIIG